MNYLEKLYEICKDKEADDFFHEHWDIASNISDIAYDFGWAATAELLDDCGVTLDSLKDFVWDGRTLDGEWRGDIKDKYDDNYYWEITDDKIAILHTKGDEEYEAEVGYDEVIYNYTREYA